MYYNFENLYSVDKKKAYQLIIDYEKRQMQEKIDLIESNSYRLGNFLLTPFILLKHLIKKSRKKTLDL